jgi:hypothetical protein
MVISKKPIDIVSLVKENNGCIELTKDLYKSLYSRTRLTETFLIEQKKQLAKFGVYMTETDRKSLLFSTPNKTFSDRFIFIENVNRIKMEQQAEEYECRLCDVKLFEALDTACNLMDELNKYKDNSVNINNKSYAIFGHALGQFDEFYLKDSVSNVRDGLHDVQYEHRTPSDFIAEYEEFYDGIRDDSILDSFNLDELENINSYDEDDEDIEGDDRYNIPDILDILEGIRLALADAGEELYLNYIDPPVFENSP